jgi:putative addiction module antidote
MNAPAKLHLAKLIKIGNSTGVVLSRDMLARLGAQAGDTVKIVADDTGFTITRSDDEFESQMNAAREVMKRRTRALRELAK